METERRKGEGKGEREEDLLVEAVEAIIESAQGNRVQSQSRRVVRYIDPIKRSESFPLKEDLLGNVDHLREHVVKGIGSKNGHEDAMGLSPI